MTQASVHKHQSLDNMFQQREASSRQHFAERFEEQEMKMKECVLSAVTEHLKKILPSFTDRFAELEETYVKHKLPIEELRIQVDRHIQSQRDTTRAAVSKIAKDIIPKETKAHFQVALERLENMNKRVDMMHVRLDGFENRYMNSTDVGLQLARWKASMQEDGIALKRELQLHSDSNWERVDALIRLQIPRGEVVVDAKCRQALTAMHAALEQILEAGAHVHPTDDLPPLGTPGAAHVRTVVGLIRSRNASPAPSRPESRQRSASPTQGAPAS